MWFLINLIQALLIFFWTAFCALFGMLMLVFGRNNRLQRWISGYLWSWVVIKLTGSSFHVYGRENVVKDTPMIFASNHQSLFDIPTCFMGVTVCLHFIAKKELKKIPFLAHYMMATGMIFIDRKDREKAFESMREAGELIKSGRNVISYPEGTRSKDGKLALFRRGTFVLASEAEIPVVPVAIAGTYQIMPPGRFKVRPSTVQIAIGKPIYPISEETPEEMASRTQQAVQNLLDSMPNESLKRPTPLAQYQ